MADELLISYEVLPPPSVEIATPANAAVYEQGQSVAASYACADGQGAPGIEACEVTAWYLGSSGNQTQAISSGADLPTAETGSYQVSGTAKSKDGLKSSVTREYKVVSARKPKTTERLVMNNLRPVMSHVSETHLRWREGNNLAALIARSIPTGTRFAFSLNQAARVRASFIRHVRGHAHFVGSFALEARAGSSAIAFDGRLSRHNRLPPGSYTLTLAAVNSAHETSAPRILSFTIER